MDRLAALNVGERAEAIAIEGGELEVHRLRRLAHQALQLLLDLGRFAAEEFLGVADQLGIAGFVDPADAGGAAAADLIKQTGRVRLAKKLSLQLRRRNNFCSEFSVLRTDPALAKGP